MSVVMPFAGVRPPRELALNVAAPPYDVVNAEEARAYAGTNQHSFFHISRPEIYFPKGSDEHSEPVYKKGLENLHAFLKQGFLKQDTSPRFYVYRQVMGSHAQV